MEGEKDRGSRGVITQRQAQEEDITQVFLIKRAALREYVENIWGWDEQFQRSRHEINYVPERTQIIECDGSPIGILETVVHDHILELINIEFIPEFQSRGIGSKVLEHLQKEACLAGKGIVLRVFKVNPAAIRFYKRHGFEETGAGGHHVHMAWIPGNLCD